MWVLLTDEAGTMSYQPWQRSATPVQEMDVAAFAAYTDISETVAESLAEHRHLPAGCFPERHARLPVLAEHALLKACCDCQCG